MIVYKYIFFHLYEFVNHRGWRNPRESAILYISLIITFLTIPFIIALEVKVAMPKILFLTIFVAYGFVIFWLNKRYIEQKTVLIAILNRFKYETSKGKKMGYIISFGTLLISPIILLVLLKFLLS